MPEPEVSVSKPSSSPIPDHGALISDIASLASVALAVGAALVLSPGVMALSAVGAAVAAATKIHASRRSSSSSGKVH
jgi:hypothetical protein